MATLPKRIEPCYEIQTMSESGIDFLIEQEGIRLKPYRDSAGIPTIGIGATYYENNVRVTMKDKPITLDRAKSLFMHLLHTYEKAVWSNTRNDINQNQFDALTSICYNIGIVNFKNSTLLRRVNKNKNDQAIKEAFEMWKYADGEPILLERRKREWALYFS